MTRFVLLAAALAFAILPACSGGPDDPDGGTGDSGMEDGGSLGATGDPCPNGPSDCVNSICLTGEGGQSFCSEYCSPGSCGGTYVCQPLVFTDPNGLPADVRRVCSEPCASGGDCPSGTCDATTGVCAEPAEATVAEGDPCGGTDGVCALGSICFAVDGVLTCVSTCPGPDTAFCGDPVAPDLMCWSISVPEGGLCWPGGSVTLGGACTDHLQCGAGLLCVDQGGATCRKACDPAGGSPACTTGTCLQLTDRPYGFCDG